MIQLTPRYVARHISGALFGAYQALRKLAHNASRRDQSAGRLSVSRLPSVRSITIRHSVGVELSVTFLRAPFLIAVSCRPVNVRNLGFFFTGRAGLPLAAAARCRK